MSAAAENVKLFEYYSLCPPELRMMITNMMEPIDRCRYGMCSRKCNAEAKAAINYIHTLEIQYCGEDLIVVEVRYTDSDETEVSTGFKMGFRIENDYIYMIHLTQKDQQMWWKLLDSSMINAFDKFVGLALQYFNDLLKVYQRGIKKVSIDWTLIKFNSDVDFGVRSLKNLEELKINGNVNYNQFLSKLSKPLSDLTIDSNTGCQNLVEQPQFFEVQHQLISPNLQLNNEQFLRLSAQTIHIHIGQLTVTDVLNFIQSWQNGTIRKIMKKVTWNLKNTNFNVTQLFTRLGLAFSNGMVKIRHHMGSICAELVHSAELLEISFPDIISDFFDGNEDEEWEDMPL